MKTTDLANLEMVDAWYENDPAMRVRVNFAFFAGTDNASSSVVYFEIETGRLSAGEAALIPAMVTHGVRSTGT